MDCLRSNHDDGDLAIEDPGELRLHDRLALHDALLAICEALELGQQALHILLRLLRLRRQPLQLRDLPVLHQELHDVHIVLHRHHDCVVSTSLIMHSLTPQLKSLNRAAQSIDAQ